jgi:hypothetical protein
VLKALEVARIAVELLLRDVRARVSQCVGLPRQVGLEVDQFAEGVSDRGPNRGRAGKLAVLIQDGEAQVRRPRDAPGRGAHLAFQDAEQRRLPRAIPSDHPPLVAFTDGEGDIAQDRRRPKGDPDAVERELRHERRVRPDRPDERRIWRSRRSISGFRAPVSRLPFTTSTPST